MTRPSRFVCSYAQALVVDHVPPPPTLLAGFRNLRPPNHRPAWPTHRLAVDNVHLFAVVPGEKGKERQSSSENLKASSIRGTPPSGPPRVHQTVPGPKVRSELWEPPFPARLVALVSMSVEFPDEILKPQSSVFSIEKSRDNMAFKKAQTGCRC
jgi:hypothetical protein